MGQSSSGHAVTTRANNRRLCTIPAKHTRRYTHEDDGFELTWDAPKTRHQTVWHRHKAPRIRHLLRRLSESGAAPVDPPKGLPAWESTTNPSQHGYTTSIRHVDHDGTLFTCRYATEQSSMSQNSKSESEHQQPRQRECVVCTDSRPLSNFPLKPPTAQCTHNPNVCRRCLQTWISTVLTSKVWSEVQCLICYERLAYDDVCEYASSKVFCRYDELGESSTKEIVSGFHGCLTRGCKSGQVVDANDKLHWAMCRMAYYLKHNTTWNKGESCDEHGYRCDPRWKIPDASETSRTNKRVKKQEEKASETTIKMISKACPGCRCRIEKSYGCDHMTCKFGALRRAMDN